MGNIINIKDIVSILRNRRRRATWLRKVAIKGFYISYI